MGAFGRVRCRLEWCHIEPLLDHLRHDLSPSGALALPRNLTRSLHQLRNLLLGFVQHIAIAPQRHAEHMRTARVRAGACGSKRALNPVRANAIFAILVMLEAR